MIKTRSSLRTGLFCAVLGLAGGAVAQTTDFNQRPPNNPAQKPAVEGQTRAPVQQLGVAYDVVTVAQGLANPWGLAFLPDGRMLVTERPGRLRVVSANGTLSAPVAGLPAIYGERQGGLLGIALDPNYASNGLIYWAYSEPRADGTNNTAVARGRFVDGAAPRVDNVQVIFHQAPSLNSGLHFGGRLIFARDGTLFVTLGERSILEGRVQAQRPDGLLGKLVRINADGSVPADNPFVGRAGYRPEIWSIGHRNVQGATINPMTGELWTIEHGTRGGDEINIPKKGKDYGWPSAAYGIEYNGSPIEGATTTRPGTEQPIYYWDPVIAPGNFTFYTGNLFPAWQNSLFVSGLGARSLVRLSVDGDKVVGEERLSIGDTPDRVRDVVQGPDGALYLLTDNAQGRVLKLVPKR